MKKYILATCLALVGSSASAITRTAEVIFIEHVSTSYETVYVSDRECKYTNYSDTGDAVGGMIIGGIIGKALTGDDQGAAVGAIIGLGAGANSKKVQTCYDVTRPSRIEKNKYVIHWKTYNGDRGYFYSDVKYPIGDVIYVEVPYRTYDNKYIHNH